MLVRKMGMTEEKFDLSKRIVSKGKGFLRWIDIEDFKEFIEKVKEKVLLNWKGQNEFIDYMNKLIGKELSVYGERNNENSKKKTIRKEI